MNKYAQVWTINENEDFNAQSQVELAYKVFSDDSMQFSSAKWP